MEKIIQRMKGRIAKLRKRSRSVTEAAADVTLHSHILINLDRILQEAQAIPAAPQATQAPAYDCHICKAAFDTAHGLHMHTAKMQRDSLPRFIPPTFDRELHAKDGMPVCAACNNCRGPARRRTLCVKSPPRGLCPAPVLKCFSCKSSDGRCRDRPDRNSQSKLRCPRHRFYNTVVLSVDSGRLITPRSSHIYDRRIPRSGKRRVKLQALYARATQFTPSKASPALSAEGQYTIRRSTHSNA